MDKKIIIGITVAVIVIIVIIIVVCMKKEKFVLNGNSLVTASGTAKSQTRPNYLTADTSGNLATTADGVFNSLDVEQQLTVQGYPGNVGDVLVSNGTTAPPVWAAGVGLSDFTGTNQSIAAGGYQIFPGGFIIQWGVDGGSGTFTFPMAFPTICVNVSTTTVSPLTPVAVNSFTQTNFNAQSTSVNKGNTSFSWLAIGF